MREEPTAYDLERFLVYSGMVKQNPTELEKLLDTQLAIDAAYQDFKRDTKIKVFFAETNPTTRYYDSDGGAYVQIPPYFTITAVHVGTSFETTSESQSNVLDYLKIPDSDPPYTMLTFDTHWRRGPQRFGVTGRRGWSDDFPADAFRAILGQAAGVHLQPSIAAAIKSGAVRWQEGDVSEQYGEMGAYSVQSSSWAKYYRLTVANYIQRQVHAG